MNPTSSSPAFPGRPRELRVPGAVRSFKVPLAALVAAGALSGCSPDFDPILALLPPSIRATLGLPEPAAVAPVPDPSASPSETVLDARTRARMNSEILQEMYRVALQREPESRAQFGTLVDTLNQGASFEGIYNGLIHSAAWASLESTDRSAGPAAIRAFAEQMAFLELSLPPAKRRVFTAADTRPLSVTIDYGALERDAARIEAGAAPSAPPEAPALPPAGETWEEAVKRIETVFVGANLHTLKRQLGDEVMRVIAEKRGERLELVVWFGEFAARTSALGIDFGLEKRNETSADFHRSWAWAVSVDRIQWEALNRVHRILNDANVR